MLLILNTYVLLINILIIPQVSVIIVVLHVNHAKPHQVIVQLVVVLVLHFCI